MKFTIDVPRRSTDLELLVFNSCFIGGYHLPNSAATDAAQCALPPFHSPRRFLCPVLTPFRNRPLGESRGPACAIRPTTSATPAATKIASTTSLASQKLPEGKSTQNDATACSAST
jgi:hypothetical protein